MKMKMKMKRVIISLGIILFLFWVFYNNDTGPYSGTYDFKENPNFVLKLRDNHTFKINYTVGKDSLYIKGQYAVDSDNNITLIPDKDNVYKFIDEPLTGKIMGSSIKITSLNGEFIKE